METTPTQTSPDLEREVVLLLNIGDIGASHHHWVETREIHAFVGDPDAVILELQEEFDRTTVTPRQWRALAARLDDLVAKARAAMGTRYIVAGHAPLPVFAYLGAAMRHMPPISVANSFDGKWEIFGPPQACPTPGHDDFTVTPPTLRRLRAERVALSIQCSKEYRDPNPSIRRLLAAENQELLDTYAIHRSHSHKGVPLSPAELPVILEHVETGLQWIGKHDPDAASLMVSIAGPSWVAFWTGHHLNPNVCGRFDLPNYVPGEGYKRALAYPMAKAPWLEGKARLLFVNAEPVEQTRTRVGKSFDEVQLALERELGEDGPYEIRHRPALQIREFMREVERFRPDILHLHLHGSPTGDLAFEDDRGRTDRMTAEQFVAQLRATGVQPTLIVLNACHSAALAPALIGIAECVVAMKDTVHTDDVIAFSRYFYGAIGRGNSLATAIAQGRAGSGLGIVGVEPATGLPAENIVFVPRRPVRW